MPIPSVNKSEQEKDYISRCISAIGSEYDVEGQAYAICKSEFDKKEKMAKIPVEIAGDNEEKILEYLPEVKSGETEDEYLARCVIVLYPEYVDEQQGYSLCADKYQRKITIQNNKATMKQEKMSAFDRKKLEFQVELAKADLRKRGINLAEEGTSYPFDQCVQDQLDRGYDDESAHNICGAIKRDYGH